jgi:maltoporin
MPSANRFSAVERKPSMFRTRVVTAFAFALVTGASAPGLADEPPNGGPRRPEQPTSTTTPATPATRSDEHSAPNNAAIAPTATPSGRFEFGSYGRVNVASDLRGRTGRDADIVAHGSRVDDDSYAELELRREDAFSDGIRTRIVTTLALFPPFFHFSGVASDRLAVRQLYAQASQGDWTLWGGARMYRGDDIYLLNWWPLDNQNTVGGGVAKAFGETSVALHAGMQRLDLPSQFQQIPSPTPYSIGAANVTVLDRPRTVETAKVTHLMRGLSGATASDGLKLALYGEAHQMAAGVRRDVALQSQIPLPQDDGWLIGSQVVYFTGVRDTYAAFFFRHARGLAIHDPLASPTTLANDKTSRGAHETLFALAGNFEERSFGIQWGSYLRFLRGATESGTSLDRYDEGIVVVRPQWYVTDHVGIAVEGSYQARRYGLLDVATDGPLSASVVRGAILPYFSPAGRGAFARPRLGLVYAASSRSDTARTLYPRDDPFAWRSSEHYLGLAVEWWFNMSSYP